MTNVVIEINMELMNSNDVEDFLHYCTATRNLSEGTLRMYRSHLRTYMAWGSGAFDVPTVDMYRDHLIQKGLKRSTIQGELSVLRSLSRYLRKRGLTDVAIEDIELGKPDVRVIKVLTVAEINKLLHVARKSPRDTAIMELLFSTGMRVSEIVSLNRSAVAPEMSIVGKGRKVRTIYVSPRALRMVDSYLKTRKDSDEALFIRVRGTTAGPRRISARSVERMVEKYVLKAGVTTKATPHTFRHSFATDILRNGANLVEVQKFLGHSNVSTTSIYTHVTSAELAAAHKKFHSHSD